MPSCYGTLLCWCCVVATSMLLGQCARPLQDQISEAESERDRLRAQIASLSSGISDLEAEVKAAEERREAAAQKASQAEADAEREVAEVRELATKAARQQLDLGEAIADLERRLHNLPSAKEAQHRLFGLQFGTDVSDILAGRTQGRDPQWKPKQGEEVLVRAECQATLQRSYQTRVTAH
jgi:predicted RNase H-like nuclease (RuvC/YqgF family)